MDCVFYVKFKTSAVVVFGACVFVCVCVFMHVRELLISMAAADLC